MRTWLLKFKISTSLDAGKGVPPPLLRQADRHPETARFARAALALDDALEHSVSEPQPPPGLHQTIMRSVRATRAARCAAAPRRYRLLPRWLVASGATACAIWLGTVLRHHLPARQPLSAPPTHVVARPPSAPDLSDLVARASPTAVVSPLAEEFQHLGQDLDRTERFLLASLP